MKPIILDCYTDEASGLGVPPYLGTYPRYLYGALKEKGYSPDYLTIDDLRFAFHNLTHNNALNKRADNIEGTMKTNIRMKHITRPLKEINSALNNSDTIFINGGIHVPGKYLSAIPGTFYEIRKLVSPLHHKKVLFGPATIGNRLVGGRKAEGIPEKTFDVIERNILGIEDYDNVNRYSLLGAEMLKQIPYPVVVELESGRGCPMRCSFCLEPVKYDIEERDPENIIEEAEALSDNGAEHFRFGKATDFYAYGKGDNSKMESLLKGIKKRKPKTLHIDNANPNSVTEKKTRTIVKYCTPGNIAAFGVETFDIDVIRKNRLNTLPEKAMDAVRILNKIGGKRGDNGMHLLLPGINILLGLLGENKETHRRNMDYLDRILDENLLLRRINIRQVAAFEGTYLYDNGGTKFVKKNKKNYWKWRHEIRQNIDFPMLKRLVPEGTVIKKIYTEIHDGKTTFGRQFGTYPLIVGIRERLPLDTFFDVKITGHMLRSVTGEKI